MRNSARQSLYLSDDPLETTFKYDETLPNLPVPSLEQSISRLLDSIRPLAQDNNELAFKQTEQLALASLSDPNVRELHELLKQRAQAKRNWLEDWWLEFAYLRSRKPLVPYSNMAAPLPIQQHWPKLISGQDPDYGDIRARRAALSTHFQLCFWQMLRNEQMRPMIHKGSPWSMNQFRYLFNTVRRPGEPKDELQSWFKTSREGLPESTEIIVIHKGHLFALKPVTMLGSRTCIASAPQIERALKHIETWCSGKPQGDGVGALTTTERSDWTDARRQLVAISDHNRRLVERIERALSVLVLDDSEPADMDEAFRLSMCGQASNRWADKSITSIAFKNGTFGASADHTPYDGFCTGVMTHYLISALDECEGAWQDELGAAANSSWAVYQEPELLQFELNVQVRHLIGDACDQFDTICKSIDTKHSTFDHYGKDILKQHRFHPEAFVQCAIHAAYYKMHQQMAPAYVTASTRRFYNGRTETCRSCYPEMLNLAKFLADANVNNKPKLAYDLLRKSVDKFQHVMQEASEAKGCDRHLLGIYLIAMLEDRQIPKLFDDELVRKTNNYVLSTSCGGYWNVCGGVPPLVEDGYGCFYGIEDFAITFCCTAYKSTSSDLVGPNKGARPTNLGIFYEHLQEALLKMQKVLLNSKL